MISDRAQRIGGRLGDAAVALRRLANVTEAIQDYTDAQTGLNPPARLFASSMTVQSEADRGAATLNATSRTSYASSSGNADPADAKADVSQEQTRKGCSNPEEQSRLADTYLDDGGPTATYLAPAFLDRQPPAPNDIQISRSYRNFGKESPGHMTTGTLLQDYRSMVKSCEIMDVLGRSFLRIEKLKAWVLPRLGVLLKEIFNDDSENSFLSITTRQVHETSLVVFCVLLDIENGRLIETAIKRDMQDQSLPIHLHLLRSQLASIPGLHDPESLAQKFWKRQWAFCPAKFRLNSTTEYLPNVIVPIIKKEAINTKGGTASVWQIEVLEEFIDQPLRDKVASSRYNTADDTLGWVSVIPSKFQKPNFERDMVTNEYFALALPLRLEDFQGEHEGPVRSGDRGFEVLWG